MDADPEFESDILRKVGILPRHVALDLHGAMRCIDSAGELDQQAVAGGLDDAAVNRRALVTPSVSIKSDTCDADRRRDPAPKHRHIIVHHAPDRSAGPT